MSIEYRNAEDFYSGIHALIVKGLTFRADYDGLVIYLTGGY